LISKSELEKALPFAKDYTEIKIPKRSGGSRTLLIPSPELKKVQRRILKFLKKVFPTHYGYINGLYSGSYVEHAKRHSNSRFIFVFDLKDAFTSINASKVSTILFKEFINQGIYPSESTEIAELITQLTTFKGTLPQGAPTSPFLFLLAITQTRLFNELFRICPPRFTISCYVDNFVISGPKPLPDKTKQKIFECIENFGFKVNTRKTRQFDCQQGAPLITGVRVNGTQRISLPKKKIRKWRGIIHRATLEKKILIKKELIQRIQGFIASLKPIYGENLPPQIAKPYAKFKNSIQN